MNDVLDNPFSSYEHSAWRVACDDSGRRSVEYMTVLGLALYGGAKAIVDRWQRRVEAGDETFRPDDARAFEAIYRSIGRAFDSIEVAVKRVEDRGHDVDQAADFRAAHEELQSLLEFSVDRLLAAEQEADRGQTRSAGEIRDELHRKVYGAG